ncbi:MAG: hypothetical protein ACOX3U_07815 [Christensenellales bacterium]
MAINTSNGKVLWSCATNGDAYSSPLFHNGVISGKAKILPPIEICSEAILFLTIHPIRIRFYK